MPRSLVLCALVFGCSNGVKGIPPRDGAGGAVGTTSSSTDHTPGTPPTTATATGTPTQSGTATGVGECGSPPVAGSVPLLPTCEFVPSPSGTPFSAKIEWAMTHEVVDPATGTVIPAYVWSEFDGYGSVYQAPAVLRATADEVPDIAAVMAHPDDRLDAVLRLVSGDGSAVHDSVGWESATNANGTFDYAPYRYAGVAMADVDGDGHVNVVTLVTRSTDDLCFPAVYEIVDDGAGNVTIGLEHVWGGTDYTCGGHAAAIADLEDDGSLEIIFGRAVFRPDLTQKWYGTGGRAWYGRPDYPYPDGYWNSGYHAFAYDMDGDGSRMEVVAGRSVYTSTGTTYCELGEYSGGLWVPAIDGYPAVADLQRFAGDVLGEPEIVITGNEDVSVFHGVPDYDPNGLARCTLIDRVPNSPLLDPAMGAFPVHPNCDAAALSFGGPPTVADFDGDGDDEIGVAGSCWFSVYRLVGSSLERFAMAETKDWSSASTGSTVFDFNGDGAAEIVFSDEDAVYVWSIDSAVGLDPWERLVANLVDTQHKSWTIHEYPLVADVDADGKAEIVVVNSHLPGYLDRFGIYVLGAEDDDWVSARDLWNQHAYYVTNMEDDGSMGYCEPNYAPYWAPDLNTFRTQAPGSFGALVAPNAYGLVDACQASCGDLSVWVQVANEGEFVSLNPDVLVGVYGETSAGARVLLASTALGAYVDGGELTAAYEFVLASADWSAYDRLVVVVDDPAFATSATGKAAECDETDNEVGLSLASFCP